MMTPKNINPSVPTKGTFHMDMEEEEEKRKEKEGKGMKWGREKEKETGRRDLPPGV